MKTGVALPIGIVTLVFGFCVSARGAPSVHSLYVGCQAPEPVIGGQSANYGITVNRAGFGSLDVYLSVQGLPAGAAASFEPAVVRFSDDSPRRKNTTLRIATAENTRVGTYPLTVTARHGTSPRVLTYHTTLIVAGPEAILMPPVITSITELPNDTILITGLGSPGQNVVIEATFSLSYIEWLAVDTVATDPLSGIFQFIDTDASLFPARFYRAIAAH